MCERKKGGKSISQSELQLFLELQLDLCFWFSTLSSLSLNHFPPKPPFLPSTQQQEFTHTPHEYARNAVNDNTLALFLFTTPHHHFTRPLPSITHHATRPHCSLTMSNHFPPFCVTRLCAWTDTHAKCTTIPCHHAGLALSTSFFLTVGTHDVNQVDMRRNNPPLLLSVLHAIFNINTNDV